jgi:hypothetical protein
MNTPVHNRSTVRKHLVRSSFAFFVVVMLAWLPGCPAASVTNSVKGKVTLNDKQVAGNVSFFSPDNKELKSPIGPDGNYYIENTKPGTTYKVAVNPLPSGGGGGGGGALPGGGGGELGGGGGGGPKKDKFVEVDKLKAGKDVPDLLSKKDGNQTVAPPPKYADANSSGLTFTTKGGAETFDLKLTP